MRAREILLENNIKLCFENCSGTDASKLGNKTQLSIQWNKLLNAKPRYVYH